MKIRPAKDAAGRVKGAITIVAPSQEIGIVRISHTQGIKQSINYQSADASYTATIACHDNPKEVRKTIKRAEKLVESALVDKVTQQTRLLKSLGNQNR